MAKRRGGGSLLLAAIINALDQLPILSLMAGPDNPRKSIQHANLQLEIVNFNRTQSCSRTVVIHCKINYK